MKHKFLIAGLAAVLLAAAAACSSPSPANTNTKTTNTTTTTTTTSNTTTSTNAPANTNTAASNTSSSSAQTGAAQDFTLVNRTGVEIDKVYITPHDSDDWEDDILGRDTLPDGESVDIKFSRKETAKMWDLRVEDKQGTFIEWENLNLLEIEKVTLYFKGGKATAETE